jgi:hypothetical protein
MTDSSGIGDCTESGRLKKGPADRAGQDLREEALWSAVIIWRDSVALAKIV